MHPEFTIFLSPDNFVTRFDSLPHNAERAKEQYQKGLDIGNESKEISISHIGTWSADTLDGGYVTSFERIGYHACSKDLLQGFLDSPAKVTVYREIDGRIQGQTIKESSKDKTVRVRIHK